MPDFTNVVKSYFLRKKGGVVTNLDTRHLSPEFLEYFKHSYLGRQMEGMKKWDERFKNGPIYAKVNPEIVGKTISELERETKFKHNRPFLLLVNSPPGRYSALDIDCLPRDVDPNNPNLLLDPE
jgi:hypothetical protein